jgi:hypothetical protein
MDWAPPPCSALGDEIGGDPGGIGRAIGNDQHFGGARDGIDADLAEDLALGGSDIGIAGADDLVDAADGFGAIGQGGDRLGAADAVDFGDAGNLGGKQDDGADLPARGGDGQSNAVHPGQLGGDGAHDDGGGIGGETAGNVDADGIDGGPAGAQRHPEGILIDVVGGELLFVVGLDAVMRGLERGADFIGHAGGGAIDFLGGNAQVGGGEIGVVEFIGQLDHGLVAARADIGDDGGDDIAHFLAGFTLAAEQGNKILLEIGAGAVEADRHGLPVGLDWVSRECGRAWQSRPRWRQDRRGALQGIRHPGARCRHRQS